MQVPSYSLALRALDSGAPPMSSTVMVNIDVSDINDNPPTFSPANLTTVIQVTPEPTHNTGGSSCVSETLREEEEAQAANKKSPVFDL